MSSENLDSLDVQKFMDDHFIDGTMAETEVYAHGRQIPIAQALVECPPFRIAIRAAARGVMQAKDITDPVIKKAVAKNVVATTISDLANQSNQPEARTDFLGVDKARTLPVR